MLKARDDASPARRGIPPPPSGDTGLQDWPDTGTARYTSTGPLDHLPRPDSAGRIIQDCYAGCADTLETPGFGYDRAAFRRRLEGWIASAAEAPVEPAAELDDESTTTQVGEDLRSAIAAAAAIGLAHSAEMLMLALSNHPLVRLSAVSHPYVLGTWMENFFKRLADVQDPDPQNKTGVRFEEKVTAAIVNWNYVQPALDTVLKSPLARALKVAATAGISALRDGAERMQTRLQLAELDMDVPPGPRKLTDSETLFINCLLCWLRNVGVDLARQVVKSPAADPLPAAERLAERFLRPLVTGPTVPGGLPAMAIATQPALGDALLAADTDPPGSERPPIALAYAMANPY